MKANHTTVVLPRLKPCQLPLGGKWWSNNSATRMFLRCAMMAGMSSTRSWVAVICLLIPRAYLNSHFLATIRTNCQLLWKKERFVGAEGDPFCYVLPQLHILSRPWM